MKKNLLLLFLTSTSFCLAQESSSKQKYWSGNFDLGLNVTKNTEAIFQLNNIFDLNYKLNNHTLTLNNNIAFISKTGQEELLNKGKQDLKYELTSKNLNIRLLIQNLYDHNLLLYFFYNNDLYANFFLIKKLYLSLDSLF